MHINGVRFGLTVVMVALALGCPAKDEGETAGADGTDGSGTAPADGQDAADAPADVDSSGDGASSIGSSSGADDDVATTTTTGDDSSDDGATTGTALCRAATIAQLDSAIAILVGDLPPPRPGGGMTTTAADTGADGGGVPDDSLRIELANVTLTCADPSIDYTCGPVQKWNITLTIPIEMQAPGVYDLADVGFGYSVVDAGAGEDCGGGGAGGLGGTLIIDAIGPDGVIGCIDSPDFFDFDGNGSFEAEMCG